MTTSSSRRTRLRRAAYADDLAYVHHTGFADLARGAAKYLVELLDERGAREVRQSRAAKRRAPLQLGKPAATVVDLGCGSGIVLQALTGAGYDAVGVDFSKPMLALAKKTAPKAKLVHGSLYTAPLPKGCAAVFAVGEPLSYGREPLAPFFRKVHRALSPGGLFVFDVITEGKPALTRRGFTSGDDWACLVDTVEDVRRNRITRDITTFRRIRGDTYTRTREVHEVRVLRESAVLRMLRHAGFHVRVGKSYGAHALAVRRRAFVCTR